MSIKDIFKKNEEDLTDAVEEEILSIVEEGHEQGTIESDEAELLNNVFEFGDKEVREIMTPRQKLVGIDQNMTVYEALSFMVDNNYSRYPVYEEDIDNIIGMVHMRDAVEAYLKNENLAIRDVVTDAIFIHPTQKISKLLKEMQDNKNHIAIVVDEYGQTEGIVALEDILEVIVGDILDEYDEEEKDIHELVSREGYIASGTTKLEEIEELFGIEFPVEDIDTINGYMLYLYGRLPNEGDQVVIEDQGFRFEAVSIKEHMITRVRIIKVALEDQE